MFRFVKILGSGVNGEVCLSENMKTFEKMAIKRLHVQNELHILQQVSPHVNIVQVVHVFDMENQIFIGMEVMDMTLKNYIKSKNLCENEIKWILKETLTGLHHCHSLSVLHRDIKPENILLNRRGHVKLCDFSLSRSYSNDMTPCVVTLWYRAPELLLGQRNYNFSIDTWSVCCVLLEMIYKYPPFIAEENSEMSQIKCIFTALGCPKEFQTMQIQVNERIKELWKNLSFVSDTFVYDIHRRPTCHELIQFIGECEICFFEIEEHRATYEKVPEGWDTLLGPFQIP